jgi:glycosyltransferase involved in cell wall biosynthesis
MQKTNFKFEILLRDDASTDGTTEIVKKYSDKYPDIINPLIYNENQYQKGISPFRDNVKRAKGKYIAICEGDDYWTDPYKLQKQVDFLEANEEYVLCCTSRMVVYEQEKNNEKKKNEIIHGTCDTSKILSGQVPFTQTMLFRNYKKLISDLNFFKNNITGDRALGYFLSLNGKIKNLSDITAVYRVTGKGIWSSKDQSVITFTNYLNLIEFHKQLGLKPINKYYLKSLEPYFIKNLFLANLNFFKLKKLDENMRIMGVKRYHYPIFLFYYIKDLFVFKFKKVCY